MQICEALQGCGHRGCGSHGRSGSGYHCRCSAAVSRQWLSSDGAHPSALHLEADDSLALPLRTLLSSVSALHTLPVQITCHLVQREIRRLNAPKRNVEGGMVPFGTGGGLVGHLRPPRCATCSGSSNIHTHTCQGGQFVVAATCSCSAAMSVQIARMHMPGCVIPRCGECCSRSQAAGLPCTQRCGLS